jgi:hypothetical protein
VASPPDVGMICCEYINWVTSNRQATRVTFFY